MKLEFINHDDLLSASTTILNATNIKIDCIEYEPRGEAQWIFGEEWSPSTPDGPAECEWCGWVCDNCQEFPTDDDWDDPDAPPKMEFCPHCGKKMTVCKVEEPQRGFRLPSPVPITENIEKKVEEANIDYDAGLWD